MCLAIPVKIISVSGSNGTAALGSLQKKIDLTLVPQAKKNDWVVVHAGFAIQIMDKSEAVEIIKTYEALDEN